MLKRTNRQRQTSEDACSNDSGCAPETSSSPPLKRFQKMSSYERAKEMYERIQEQKAQEKVIRQQEREKRQASLQMYIQSKKKRNKVLRRQLSKGVQDGAGQVRSPHSESHGAESSADTDFQSYPFRRTVQTADNGVDRGGGHLVHDDESSLSSEEESPTSSSIAQPNIELRKQKALPMQKWTKEQNYSSNAPTMGSSSPVLASTPQPRVEWQLSQPSNNAATSETPILGDVTNHMDQEILLDRSDKRSPSRRAENMPASHIAYQQTGSTANNEFIGKPHARTPSQPVAAHEVETSRQKGYTDVERKLVEQLRNAIAHLDLADIEQQRKAKEAYVRFRGDIREFEEQKEAEKERVQRIRRQLERERKTLNKDGAEKDKVVAEQIEDLNKVIAQKDRQISSLRLRLRKVEELGQTKEKELEENNKKVERLERTVNTLQRQLAQIRGNHAKQSQEMAVELQAARAHNLRRKGAIGLLQTVSGQAAHGTPVDTVKPQDSEQQRSHERSKCVSWADKASPAQMSSEPSPYTRRPNQMRFFEDGVGYFGLCRLFRNEIGDWTKITTTDCGCDFYEYSNSDIRWISCDRTVEINYFGIVGATVVTLIKGCSIRYFNNGQIELYRLSGEISRFDPLTKKRTETMVHPDGLRYVEIFDPSGCFVRLEGISQTSHNFGERSSYRGHPSDRHVYNHSNFEPEWIEPEYNARRCPDGSLKIKFASIMVCCLGVEDVGYVKHTTRLENGSERKRMCVEWGHVARARQRQIEARKCQELTALNATM